MGRSPGAWSSNSQVPSLPYGLLEVGRSGYIIIHSGYGYWSSCPNLRYFPLCYLGFLIASSHRASLPRLVAEGRTRYEGRPCRFKPIPVCATIGLLIPPDPVLARFSPRCSQKLSFLFFLYSQ